jgi:hypothetical protein
VSQLPHPVTAILLLEQRHAEYLAASERDRLAALAERRSRPPHRLRWRDLLISATLAIAQALPVTAGTTGLLKRPSPTDALAPLTAQ